MKALEVPREANKSPRLDDSLFTEERVVSGPPCQRRRRRRICLRQLFYSLSLLTFYLHSDFAHRFPRFFSVSMARGIQDSGRKRQQHHQHQHQQQQSEFRGCCLRDYDYQMNEAIDLLLPSSSRALFGFPRFVAKLRGGGGRHREASEKERSKFPLPFLAPYQNLTRPNSRFSRRSLDLRSNEGCTGLYNPQAWFEYEHDLFNEATDSRWYKDADPASPDNGDPGLVYWMEFLTLISNRQSSIRHILDQMHVQLYKGRYNPYAANVSKYDEKVKGRQSPDQTIEQLIQDRTVEQVLEQFGFKLDADREEAREQKRRARSNYLTPKERRIMGRRWKPQNVLDRAIMEMLLGEFESDATQMHTTLRDSPPPPPSREDMERWENLRKYHILTGKPLGILLRKLLRRKRSLVKEEAEEGGKTSLLLPPDRDKAVVLRNIEHQIQAARDFWKQLHRQEKYGDMRRIESHIAELSSRYSLVEAYSSSPQIPYHLTNDSLSLSSSFSQQDLLDTDATLLRFLDLEISRLCDDGGGDEQPGNYSGRSSYEAFYRFLDPNAGFGDDDYFETEEARNEIIKISQYLKNPLLFNSSSTANASAVANTIPSTYREMYRRNEAVRRDRLKKLTEMVLNISKELGMETLEDVLNRESQVDIGMADSDGYQDPPNKNDYSYPENVRRRQAQQQQEEEEEDGGGISAAGGGGAHSSNLKTFRGLEPEMYAQVINSQIPPWDENNTFGHKAASDAVKVLRDWTHPALDEETDPDVHDPQSLLRKREERLAKLGEGEDRRKFANTTSLTSSRQDDEQRREEVKRQTLMITTTPHDDPYGHEKEKQRVRRLEQRPWAKDMPSKFRVDPSKHRIYPPPSSRTKDSSQNGKKYFDHHHHDHHHSEVMTMEKIPQALPPGFTAQDALSMERLIGNQDDSQRPNSEEMELEEARVWRTKDAVERKRLMRKLLKPHREIDLKTGVVKEVHPGLRPIAVRKVRNISIPYPDGYPVGVNPEEEEDVAGKEKEKEEKRRRVVNIAPCIHRGSRWDHNPFEHYFPYPPDMEKIMNSGHAEDLKKIMHDEDALMKRLDGGRSQGGSMETKSSELTDFEKIFYNQLLGLEDYRTRLNLTAVPRIQRRERYFDRKISKFVESWERNDKIPSLRKMDEFLDNIDVLRPQMKQEDGKWITNTEEEEEEEEDSEHHDGGGGDDDDDDDDGNNKGRKDENEKKDYHDEEEGGNDDDSIAPKAAHGSSVDSESAEEEEEEEESQNHDDHGSSLQHKTSDAGGKIVDNDQDDEYDEDDDEDGMMIDSAAQSSCHIIHNSRDDDDEEEAAQIVPDTEEGSANENPKHLKKKSKVPPTAIEEKEDEDDDNEDKEETRRMFESAEREVGSRSSIDISHDTGDDSNHLDLSGLYPS